MVRIGYNKRKQSKRNYVYTNTSLTFFSSIQIKKTSRMIGPDNIGNPFYLQTNKQKREREFGIHFIYKPNSIKKIYKPTKKKKKKKNRINMQT